MFDERFLAGLRQEAERYEKEAEEQALSFPDRKKRFETASGIPIKRAYSPLDLAGRDYSQDIGWPGQYPFTRAVQHTAYRGKFWTFRQYAGYGTADESNQRYKYLLETGNTGLSVAFDLPTQLGYDSDHPIARGEVGKVGVAIDTLEDMERLFDGIPLDKISTSMTCNAHAAMMLAMYVTVAEQQGIPPTKLTGTIQNDILKEYVARGTYIFPPKPSMRIITDIFAYCSKQVPRWNTISICGYHLREAGCNAMQELAFMLADGIAYVEAAIKAGLEVDRFGPRLSWLPNTMIDFFEEIAKFRAARRMWAKIMKERFGAKDPRSCTFRVFTGTAGSSFTAHQPFNNVIRGTIETMAAVLGGCQALHVCSFDEALALPTEEAVRVAMRTQQIVAYESGIADTIDPLAGSFYVETLTNELEERAWDLIAKIDKLGGAVAAIEKGYYQSEIIESAYRYQREVETGERVIVGVNQFKIDDEPEIVLHQTDPAIELEQVQRLKAVKSRRDAAKVERILAELRTAAQGDANLLPPLIDAVKAYATLGEICAVLRDVFGAYQPPQGF
ncbi:MAG: methylmalonyl-CoA mutase family protein [Candidatus Tectomicrobia bacterium]|nr:methylmalonyl-CoA mutase family protein [Candidatus Tectomicrobia bacterium]